MVRSIAAMTPADSVRVALASRDQLGEGPVWDERRGELLRVDIARGRVHGWRPSDGSSWSRQIGGEVSAAIPRAIGDGLVLAMGRRLVLDDGQVLAEVEPERPANRLNDCKCDPQGRLWAGTMAGDRARGAAALYRLVPGGEIEQVIPDTTISNGLGWSGSGDRMYFVDSATQRIDVLDFDAGTGEVDDRRPFASVEPADGLPDGLATDAEGGVWVCLFGGGAVRRYDEEGGLDAVIPLPVTNPTSAVFGGPDLRTMYVTSARHGLSSAQLAAEPLAGAVLALEPGVSGLPGSRFAG
jgi:sugar lactone lactonase YvrE